MYLISLLCIEFFTAVVLVIYHLYKLETIFAENVLRSEPAYRRIDPVSSPGEAGPVVLLYDSTTDDVYYRSYRDFRTDRHPASQLSSKPGVHNVTEWTYRNGVFARIDDGHGGRGPSTQRAARVERVSAKRVVLNACETDGSTMKIYEYVIPDSEFVSLTEDFAFYTTDSCDVRDKVISQITYRDWLKFNRLYHYAGANASDELRDFQFRCVYADRQAVTGRYELTSTGHAGPADRASGFHATDG